MFWNNKVFLTDIKSSKDLKVKILGFFPLLKIKLRKGKIYFLLFNFLPVWKIQDLKNFKIHFLFSFLPVFFSVKDEQYYFISIGDNCSCAQYLKNVFLRDFSLPLDWIAFASTPKTLGFIADRFKDFFNKEDFVYQHPYDDEFDVYYNKFAGYCSFHDFPKGNFDESFSSVKEKYERRIKRFCDLLDNYSNVLIRTKNFVDEKLDKQEILELCEKINRTYKQKQYFVFFEHDENMPEDKLHFTNLSSNILIVKCCCYNKKYRQNAALSWLGNQIAYNEFFAMLRFKSKNKLFKVLGLGKYQQ